MRALEPNNPGSLLAVDDAQMQQFIRDGYVKLTGAFPREVADRARAILWRDTGCDPDKPATWTKPVIRLGNYWDAPSSRRPTRRSFTPRSTSSSGRDGGSLSAAWHLSRPLSLARGSGRRRLAHRRKLRVRRPRLLRVAGERHLERPGAADAVPLLRRRRSGRPDAHPRRFSPRHREKARPRRRRRTDAPGACGGPLHRVRASAGGAGDRRGRDSVSMPSSSYTRLNRTVERARASSPSRPSSRPSQSGWSGRTGITHRLSGPSGAPSSTPPDGPVPMAPLQPRSCYGAGLKRTSTQ